MVEELVESGLDGPAGMKDVVDEDDGRAIDVEGDKGRRLLLGDRVAADVVAVEGDVDRAGGGLEAGPFQAPVRRAARTRPPLAMPRSRSRGVLAW